MIQHLGYFVLRAPLFSYEGITKDAPLELEELLEKALMREEFLEAIFWASPTLHGQALKRIAGKDHDRERVSRSLKKYLLRASSRCTPFGLFAGCNVGKISHKKDKLVMPEEGSGLHRHVRMDMHLLLALSNHFSRDKSLAPALRYYPNTSLYEVGDAYRYVEYELQQGVRGYRVASVEKDELLEKILSGAKAGMQSQELVALIDLNAQFEEKEAFVRQLIDSQLLVSELEISVTTADQLAALLEILTRIGTTGGDAAVHRSVKIVADLQAGIALLNQSSSAPNREAVVKLFREALLEIGVETQSNNFFQVDFVRSAHEELALSEATVRKTLQAIEALSRISTAETMQERYLREFRSAFVEKYETAEVPLAEVIDGEVGIGFPVLSSFGNVSKDSYAHAYIQGKPVEKYQEPWHAYLQRQYEQVLRQGGGTLDLRDEDIAKFPPKVNQLAPTFAAMLSMVCCGEGDQVYLQSVGGTTANNLLGRFGDLDRSLGDLCLRIAEKERALLPDTVLAEIVHLPEGRVGNILQRPVLGKYQIPYLSGPSVGGENSLLVADLTVAVEGSTIVLRSKRLGKKVIPRLSNAHNYAANSLPVYHFLCAVQHQGKAALGIDWGEWARGVTFIPRVTYQGVILQAASWKFSPEDFVPVLTADDPLEALRTFFDYWKLPASVAITQADNQLVCHIGRKEYREIFLQEVQKTKNIQVVEWLHFAEDIDGQPYTHQVVVPLCQKVVPFANPAKQVTTAALQRAFFPGSEWLYMKIYCGAHLSDRILLDGLLAPLETLRASGIIDKFFFVRYADPHYHIRLRLHLAEAATGFGAALECLYAALEPYTQKRLVWKVQLDTYNREIERYQAHYMELSESFFFFDSRMFLNAFAQLNLEEDEGELRMLYALESVEGWFDTFELNLHQRASLVQEAAKGLGKEFDPGVKIELDQQYRAQRKRIQQTAMPHCLKSLLDRRLEEVRTAAAIYPAGRLLDNLSHYLHMSLNRWFTTDQRLKEFRVYYFLQKRYAEKLKRASI